VLTTKRSSPILPRPSPTPQPRILGAAQERLTHAITDVYDRTNGWAQQWARAMLTTVGRGGNAQVRGMAAHCRLLGWGLWKQVHQITTSAQVLQVCVHAKFGNVAL